MIPLPRFETKVAIVTGAGQGIGFEICRQLAMEGASVILNDLDEALAQKAADHITSDNGRCIAVAGDSSTSSCIQQMISAATTNFGRLDIVIANAGITLFAGFFEYTPESFNRVLQVNLFGSFFLTQAAAKQFKEQDSGGSILLMSSVTAHAAHENLAAYSITKAGLEMLAKNLVIELSPFKININAIAPGATLTERTMSDTEYERTWSEITPIGRPALANDIANAALFLFHRPQGTLQDKHWL